jgi:hypothetical protein
MYHLRTVPRVRAGRVATLPTLPRMGELVRGRYELLAVLGRGGDNEVVQAIDRQHDRLVALKLRRVGSDDLRERLLAEGRALLGLRPHPALPVVRGD